MRYFVSMAPERTASETSPLLGHTNGTASTGAIDIPHEESAEQRQNDDGEAKETVREAQNRLKYIIPAVSLGVRQPSHLSFYKSPPAPALTSLG